VADTYNTNLLAAGTTDAQQLLLSLPVIVTNTLDGYDGLVVDQRAIVSATGQVEVATSVDTYFDSDSVGLRATSRTAHGVSRPNQLGHLLITGGGS
jgi:hypothetical protein